MARETWKYDEIKDIEDVVEAFNQLVFKLSKDGSQLGELYVRAEQKAARLALLSETVIDSVTSGILVVEATGEVSLANSAARRILRIDDGQDVAGKRLGDLLLDASQLESLVGLNVREGTNSSRKTLSVRTLDGQERCLGASTSCVKSSPSRADAVIVVFTDLDGCSPTDSRAVGESPCETQRQGYLTGILDCYDLLSQVVLDVERVEPMVKEGTASKQEIVALIGEIRHAWELMMAFGLSRVAANSVSEIVDLNDLATSVAARRPEFAAVNVVRDGSACLPRVKTVHKILEAGLELLVAGCLRDSAGGVTLATRRTNTGGREGAAIEVAERGASLDLAEMGSSLKGVSRARDLRREAGLMLLRSLPADCHLVRCERTQEMLVFTVEFLCPISNGPGPARRTGGLSEREPDAT